jgi:predicted phage terminase large subunit-like protein
LTHNLATALADAIEDGGWRSKARPSQLAPAGDWLGWLILAGRGFGKTRAGAGWVHEIVEQRVAGRIALVAATAADARDTIVEGVSGLLNTAPPWMRPIYEPSKRRVTWPNGAIATTFSSEEADRLRGPEHDAAWADELCAWEDLQAAWDMLQFGLRIGTRPRWIVTTTPRPIKLLKALIARPDVVLTSGSTFDNSANLAPSFIESMQKRYEGTRLGRQELEAAILSDTPGALWNVEMIDRDRRHAPDEYKRVVVAIDPAASNKEGSDETGIVVAGSVGAPREREYYVLRDLSGRYSPSEWAYKAVRAFHEFKADRIIAEVNQGGTMVEEVLRNIDPSVPFKAVHASRGKVVRAEPIAALYEQGKVYHVGSFAALEDQMCAFTSDFDRKRSGYSPDRVDALVWALSELSGNIYSASSWELLI